MDRMHPPWFLLLLWVMLPAVAGTAGPLTHLESVTGKLVFYQMEGNATYVRESGELASDVPTETMFELSSPARNFSAAEFTYTWDLGNGEVIRGTEPVVRYHYSQSGNYTMRLKVGGKQSAAPIAGVYSKDVQVLDAVRKMELDGPSDYTVFQDSSLAVHLDGSPPMWVCWRFLKNCRPDAAPGCTLTMLYDATLELNHTFTSTGVHCLDVSARNDISKMQTSFSLYVRRNDPAHLLFILSCAAVLVATFSFIVVVACRPWQQNKPQVAAFLKDQDSGGHSRIIFLPVNKGEREPLILQPRNQYCS